MDKGDAEDGCGKKVKTQVRVTGLLWYWVAKRRRRAIKRDVLANRAKIHRDNLAMSLDDAKELVDWESIADHQLRMFPGV